MLPTCAIAGGITLNRSERGGAVEVESPMKPKALIVFTAFTVKLHAVADLGRKP